MSNGNRTLLAGDLLSGILFPQKIYQAIWNVQVSTTPTTAHISFVQMFDSPGFVTLFQDGVQIRGWGATPFASGHFKVDFTDLPQDTEFVFTIAVIDPRPPGEQLPGGIVTVNGILETGLRTAKVRLHALRELQGEGEITFFSRLYDWNGSSGGAISSVVQYGRGHMDPAGSPIGDPFGPPLLLAQAPDAVALYTVAVVDTWGPFSIITAPWDGLGIFGISIGDSFPNDAPSHQAAENQVATTAQTIVNLPTNVGPFNIPFAYASGVYDYVFQIDGSIDGQIMKFNHPSTRSLTLHPRHLRLGTALKFAPHVVIVAGDTMLNFHLTVDGAIARPRAGGRTAADLERIGEINAERFVAAGRPKGVADLVAIGPDGVVMHARAGKEGAVSWTELGAKLVGDPALAHSPGGALHVFGLDRAGTLLHASIGRVGRAPRWDHWEQGFTGRIACAFNSKGEAHLFVRRGNALSHARLTLREGGLDRPRWKTMEAPFAGPVMATATEKGTFAALGLDEDRNFWLMTWDGRGSQPEGSQWGKVGTLDDLFPASTAEPVPATNELPTRTANGKPKQRAPKRPSRRPTKETIGEDRSGEG